MITIHLVLLVLAFCLFLLAAFNVSHPRVNFVALGLALLVVALWLH